MLTKIYNYGMKQSLYEMGYIVITGNELINIKINIDR